jgi:prepilin-type N-terminal cleavage/methylation domain-containing protein
MKLSFLRLENKDDGFTLVECLIVVVMMSLIMGWGLPNIRRQLMNKTTNNYTLRVEAGLQSLRMRQGVMKTSCNMQFKDNAVSSINNLKFQTPKDVLELSHLQSPTELVERDKRLKCSGNPITNQQFRFLDTERGPGSDKVEISVSRKNFVISPPGTSEDGGSLIILIRSRKYDEVSPPLQIRCVEFTGNGLTRIGSWENNMCATI